MGLYGNNISFPAVKNTTYMKLRANALQVQGVPGPAGPAGPTGPAGQGVGPWVVTTKSGSDIQISTGSTNTLHYGNFLTTAAQSTHTHGTDAVQQGSLVFNDANGITFGNSVSGYTTSMTASFKQGSLIFNDVNGITFGNLVSGYSSTITASYNSSHTHGSIYTSSITGSVISNSSESNGLTIGMPAWITTAAGGGGPAIAASNTTFTNGTVALSAQANVTLGTTETNGIQYIRISANISGETAGDGVNIIAAGGSTANSTGTIVFSNSNGISFGLNGATITAQHNALTTAAVSDHTHSNLYQSTGAYLTTAMQSASSSVFAKTGFTSSSQAGSVLSVTNNTNGLSMLVPAWVTAATGGGGVGLNTAGTNITWTVNSSGISINNPAWLTTAAASNHTHSNYINTSESGNVYFVNSLGSNLTWSSSVNGVSTSMFATAGGGGNGAGTNGAITGGSLTVNTSGVSINLPSYLTTAAVSGHTHGSNISTASTAGTGLAVSSSSNGLTLGVPAWITTAGVGGGIAASISAGNMTSVGSGYSNITSGTLFLAGGNNITLSQNGANITISGANVGGAQTGISGVGVSDTTYSSGTVIYSADANLTIASSVNGVSQYVKFSVGNYLTTAANSTHTHDYQSTGAYLTTAMQSASSSVFVKTGNTTGTTTGTDIKLTNNTDGISLAFPKYITDHANEFWIGASNTTWNEHTVFISGQTNITVGTSENGDSQYVRLSVADAIPLGNSTAYNTTVLSNALAVTNHTHSDLYINTSKEANFITSQSTHAHPYVGSGDSTAWQTGTLSSALMPLSYSSGFQTATLATKFLTTAMVSDAGSNFVPIGNSTQWATGTLSSALMPLSYSSGFQTATLATKFLTTAAAEAHTHGAGSTASTAGTDLKFTTASNGWTLGVPAWITTAAGGAGAALKGSGTYSQNSGTIEFANSNNITFGLTNNQMTASYTVPIGSLHFSDAGGVTWGSSAGTGASSNSTSIYVSSMAGGAGGAAIKGSGTYSQNTGTVEFANSNGITFGLSNNGTFTASYNSTQFAGTGTAATGAAITVNSGGVSVSVSAATGSIYFGDIAGYSWTSTTAASRTTFYLKTS